MHFALESAQMRTCEDHVEGNTRRQADADGVDDVVNLKGNNMAQRGRPGWTWVGNMTMGDNASRVASETALKLS